MNFNLIVVTTLKKQRVYPPYFPKHYHFCIRYTDLASGKQSFLGGPHRKDAQGESQGGDRLQFNGIPCMLVNSKSMTASMESTEK